MLDDSWYGPEVARMVTKFESLQAYTHSDGRKYCKQHQRVQFAILEVICITTQ